MNKKKTSKSGPWWSEEYGFFGSFYMNGDDSIEGYLTKEKQSLSERTETEVAGLETLLSLKPCSKILDCPCGYGRHSIELATKGYGVLGVDINPEHLCAAEKVSRAKGIRVRFKKGNMINLPFNVEFDAVINMFYSFGFFETDQENEKVLRRFYMSLKPGGKFLMHTDVNVPRIISGRYKTKEKRQLKSGSTLQIDDCYDPKTKRINGAWSITDRAGHSNTKHYSVRVYTKEEFESLCLKVGFKKCLVYSDWNGRPYSENSEDMIVVAIK